MSGSRAGGGGLGREKNSCGEWSGSSGSMCARATPQRASKSTTANGRKTPGRPRERVMEVTAIIRVMVALVETTTSTRGPPALSLERDLGGGTSTGDYAKVRLERVRAVGCALVSRTCVRLLATQSRARARRRTTRVFCAAPRGRTEGRRPWFPRPPATPEKRPAR